MNLKEKLLALSNPKPIPVEAPELGAGYFIRVLTVGEIMEQQADAKDGDNRFTIARGVARVLVDENNKSIFDPNDKASVDSVLQLPWPLVKKIMEQGNKVNGVEAKEPGPKE